MKPGLREEIQTKVMLKSPVYRYTRQPRENAVGFPGGSVVTNPLANAGAAGDLVRSLGWEEPLEKGMATHSSILAWRSLWTEEPSRLPSMGLQRVGHN